MLPTLTFKNQQKMCFVRTEFCYCRQVKLDEEETSNFRDRLLPLIIGLLRTVSKLIFAGTIHF